MLAKRLFDLIVSGLGLLALTPLFAVISVAIKLDSKGPVFFRQERVGRYGKPFRIHKFRTMDSGEEDSGSQITVGSDIRITRVGMVLRKHKLDELAQLLDVFLGDMSLVGPRPEVARYVALYPAEARETILSVRPGITDWASVKYRHESTVLSQSSDPHTTYVDEVLPTKLRYYTEYVKTRTFWNDIRIIAATLRALIG